MSVLIAINGWKGSGKDTSADYLVETYGAQRIGFADPLKDNVAKAYSLDRKSLDDQGLKEIPLVNLPVEPKDAFSRLISEFMVKEFRTLQGVTPEHFAYIDGRLVGYVKRPGTLGTHAEPLYWTRRALCILEGSSKRSSDSNYWVNQALTKTLSQGIFVISDLRYKSEAQALRVFSENNGIKLVTVRINRFDQSPSSDPSERDMDDFNFDVQIENKGALIDLYSATDDVMIPCFAHLRGAFT